MLHAQMVGHSLALLQSPPTSEFVSAVSVAAYIPQHAEEVVALLLSLPAGILLNYVFLLSMLNPQVVPHAEFFR